MSDLRDANSHVFASSSQLLERVSSQNESGIFPIILLSGRRLQESSAGHCQSVSAFLGALDR